MELVLDRAQIAVADMPGVPGGKILQLITEQGIRVTIPLDEKAARTVAASLTSGLIVASGPLVSPGGRARN